MARKRNTNAKTGKATKIDLDGNDSDQQSALSGQLDGNDNAAGNATTDGAGAEASETTVAADTAIDDGASSLGDEFESGHGSDQQSAVSSQPEGNTGKTDGDGSNGGNDDDRSTLLNANDFEILDESHPDFKKIAEQPADITVYPAVDELLDVPKTKVTGGKGTGDRPFVICETNGSVVVREPRADDGERPQCPNCSTDAAAVLCGAKNTKADSIGATTYYYCPIAHCTFSTQVLKPVVAANILNRHRNGGKAPSPKPHITRP